MITSSAKRSRAAMRRGSSRLTVQSWQNLTLAAMGVVVLTGAIVGTLLLHRTDDVSRELTDEYQPARVAGYRLQAALRDQETAVRGYAITADKQFLQPYYDGLSAEATAAGDIRRYVGRRAELIADVDAIEQASAAWRQTYAEPQIAGVTPGRPGPVDTAATARGKAGFDGLRTLFDRQNEHLRLARVAGLEDLNQVRGWRDRVLVAIVAAFFVMALVLALLVHSAVTRPLAMLAAACRRITQGEFGERITPRGPKDIRSIAADVEAMRQRIVEELDRSRSAHQALDDQAIELRRSNAELEQFAYVASHDLQEPLRKVASFCQLLEKRYGDKLDDRGLEYIAFAVDGAKRMQVLINDLLTFSRVGRLNAARTTVDLNAALNTAVENLSTALEASGAQIIRPQQPLPTVDGDPTVLAMVWQNLIGNAVKFQREGTTPRIVIDCEHDIAAAQWSLSVSDNGIGIGKEFVDKVFVIFQRLHGRDSYGGTGIGLALSKKIVEHHGGTIWIDTSYTGGTRFRFTLPVSATLTPDSEPAALLEGTHR